MIRACTLFAAIALLNHTAAAANEVQLRWTELGAIAIGHDVRLALPGGTVLRGEVQAIRDDSLVMVVTKTSDKKAFPKGQNSIPRTSVTVVEIMKVRGIGGRVIGTTTGVIGGLIISGEIIAHSNVSEGPATAVLLVGTVGTIVAGYFAGRLLDRRVTRIRVIP